MATREIRLGRRSDAYQVWAGQARRMDKDIADVLPVIVEAHARRALEMEERAPMGGKRDVSDKLDSLSGRSLLGLAVKERPLADRAHQDVKQS